MVQDKWFELVKATVVANILLCIIGIGMFGMLEY